MKVKSGRCDFDKIVIPHLQASFLSFLSFDLSVSCISLGSRFLFPLFFFFFLVAHLTFSPFLFIVSICFCCSRSRSFSYSFFFLSSVLDPLFYHLNQTNIRENYICSILSFVYPFSHFLLS